MKREFLTGLNLEKDVIDKIMTEHGKALEAMKARAEAAEGAKSTLEKTIADANETIKGFEAKGLDLEAAQKTAKEWEDKFKEAQRARAKEEKDNMLLRELEKQGTVDAELLRACLNMDELIIKDGKIIGLDVQLSEIKENKPYLFKNDKDKSKLKGAKLGESSDSEDDGGGFSFDKMTYSEMIAYIKEHPESAQYLK